MLVSRPDSHTQRFNFEVGAMKPEEQPSEQQHIQDLQTALQKLPRVHLIVLDTLVKHLKE